MVSCRSPGGELMSLLANTDAVIVVDTAGQIVFTNPAVSNLFGYDEEELVGQSIGCLIPAPYRQRHERQVTEFSASGRATFSATSCASISGLRTS